MDRISAAGNLTIEVKPDAWRLIVNGNAQERVLLEANPGRPLRYIPTFAIKRRLPDTGNLPLEKIQRVVLGWSNEDESWHLGLLLEADFAKARGSRWCEIARWPDPDSHVFDELAAQAGRALARTLTRPFNLIQPQPAAPATPEMPPLRALPLQFDQWTLEKGEQLQWVRSPGWVRSRVMRSFWYGLLAVVYLVLSVTSLSGGIALPKPEFLPYLGLASAALLAGIILYLLYQLLTQPDRIIIDTETRSIDARRGRRERWRLDHIAIESIYVSEVASRKGKKRVVHHGEINAYLQDGSFFNLLEQSQPVDDLLTPANVETTEAVVGLSPLSAHTDLQMAGLWVAEALNVPCWHDRRAK